MYVVSTTAVSLVIQDMHETGSMYYLYIYTVVLPLTYNGTSSDDYICSIRAIILKVASNTFPIFERFYLILANKIS